MTSLRQLLMRHRTLAAWLVAAALLMKVLVPTGFMPVVAAGSITIELCSGYGPQKIIVAMPGMHHQQHKPDHQGKEMPCTFSGLSASSLAAADPLLLAVAIAFIIATVPGRDAKRRQDAVLSSAALARSAYARLT